MLIVVELAVRDHAGLLPGVELADLLEGQQLVDRTGRIIHNILLRKGVGLHDTTGHDDGAHVLQTTDAHQHRRHGLVAARDEHAAVIDARVRLCLDEVGDRIAVCERVVDAVVALCDTVTHIGCEVAGRLTTVFVDGLHRLLHELIEVCAARMAVAEGALHHDLWLAEVLDLPAHTHLQRIILRCQCTYFL